MLGRVAVTIGWLVAGICLSLGAQASGDHPYPLMTYQGDLSDKASLQRGAGVFVTYCQGCHEMQYMRYDALAKGIGIVDGETGEFLGKTIQSHLNFVSDNPRAPMQSAGNSSPVRCRSQMSQSSRPVRLNSQKIGAASISAAVAEWLSSAPGAAILAPLPPRPFSYTSSIYAVS